MLGVKYQHGAKCDDINIVPESIDCSGLVKRCYRYVKLALPDGSQNQFNDTVSTDNPKMADLAFMAHDANINKIYHVGLVYDEKFIIEAREFDGRDWTGKVCLRERTAWEKYKNFAGYRCHKKLSNLK